MMTSMNLRQAAAILRRRITGVPSRIVSSSAPLLPLSSTYRFVLSGLEMTLLLLFLVLSLCLEYHALLGKTIFFYPRGCGGYKWRKNDSHLWIFMFGPAGILLFIPLVIQLLIVNAIVISLFDKSSTFAAILFGMNPNPVLAEDVSIQASSQNDSDGANLVGLQKIEDGSVISNIHTSKWRVFTDNGRDFFVKASFCCLWIGKLEQAEKFFLSALQEAKEGFGERDPHVASACNNLAELYRVKKAFDKAEPLYLEAINILEDSFGPEDIRLTVVVQRGGCLTQSRAVLSCPAKTRGCSYLLRDFVHFVIFHDNSEHFCLGYESILGFWLCKDISNRALKVLYLLGNVQDSEALFYDSIRILEEGGQGESMTCIRRLRYLSQIYLKANRLEEAENVQRKILHVMELLKGWNSLDTVIAAEGLALTLQSIGRLREAQELFNRCLDARKILLPEDHIQIGANMLHVARVAMLNSSQPSKTHISEAIAELDRAKELLDKSTRFLHNSYTQFSVYDRIAQKVLDKLTKQKGNKKNYGASGETTRDGHAALVILLQSLDALGLLEITKQDLLESREENLPNHQAENAFCECISAYKEFGTEKSISVPSEVKAEYLSCLKHLLSLIDNANSTGRTQPSKVFTLQELKEEIKCIEAEISSNRRSKHQN
ncbi:hypothetical protein JRO89_XS11G0031400 [Xanthoceras sorbifolium]|uniref:Kinesin light chain n=1 Tax=Xanthoceras sorbifolium TaxID=99658 RepID=A0ABQ8HEQ9_9ROSI|nr:hypothetical protein JRO89_XS11G0031400 [Xanthoceras sorbifolium]